MLRRLIYWIGEAVLTVGAVMLLFVLWQVWWSDIRANEAAALVLEDVRADFRTPLAPDDPAAEDEAGSTAGQDGRTSSPGTSHEPPDVAVGDSGHNGDTAGDERLDEGADEPAAAPTYGTAVAIVHLPTVGEERAVLKGVGLDILDQGLVGHYPDTQDPGEVGTFAVAGHRTTYGRPFWALQEVRPGDPVVVETAEGWFVYTMERHRVVLPHQTEVLGPVPDAPNETATEAWMVMTACHPKFSAAERLIGYAKLDRFVPDEDGPPPELGGGA